VTRPLCPAFLTTFALALVDDAASVSVAALSAAADDMSCAWSTSFVQHVGYWSHFDHRQGMSVWPLPPVPSCTDLAAFAASHFALVAEAPEPGDIYLLWSPARKLFVRAGIVLGCTHQFRQRRVGIGYECLTIDGDTTPRGSLRGPYTAIVKRVLSPDAGDRLIRWPLIELLKSERTWSTEFLLRRAA
jgi:hypothetical protein